MGIKNTEPARIKTSADLVFHKYVLKATWIERLLRLKTERHKVLSALIPVVQQSFKYECDSWVNNFPKKEENLDRYLDSFDYCEKECGEGFFKTMQVLEGLETETLTFVADSYKVAVTTKQHKHITEALNPLYLSRAEDSDHDINTIVKNAVSYSSYSGDYYTCYVNAFNDARCSSPELNRPDLYNLTGEKREWVARIIEVARFSRAHIGVNENSIGTTQHMNPGLALLLKEDSEWVDRTKKVMYERWLNASQVTPELMRDLCTEGARALSEGTL